MEINEKLQEKIDLAKKIAREEYNNAMIKINCFDPNYKRDWIEHKEDNKIIYALEGTPDKAFVVVNLETGDVFALRQDFSVIEKM